MYFKIHLNKSFYELSRTRFNRTDCTSFVTFMGQYEYIRMPFGLKNGPSFFMRYINRVFRSLLDDGKILFYLDDILIATETIVENVSILQEVLRIIIENCLELKFSKCAFLSTEITYLGYRINNRGIRPTKEHIRAVSDYPIPRTFRQLQSYLGFVSYFRKFIKNFATIAKPLYDLLKSKSDFKWDDKQLVASEKLNQSLISESILSIYSTTAETELHCDASSYGYGSVLMQKQVEGKFHPISYYSKRTSQTELRYHSFELEASAIIYSLERFRI